MTERSSQMPLTLSKESIMKAATSKGLSRSLIITDFDQPIPRANQVLVKVSAASVNPKDWKLNVNLYPFMPKLGGVLKRLILGDDLAGVIVDKGKNVTGFEIGDEVYGMSMSLNTGSCAEYTVIPASCIAAKPKNTSMGEAAAVPLAGLTALQCLDKGKVTKDSKVLVIGASGGVGLFAVQIAKALGAQVTAVCSGKNFELVRSVGADAVIDYTQGDYTKNKDNFTSVIDVTSYLSLGKCASLMAPGSIYVTTLGSGIAYAKYIKDKLLFRGKTATAIYVDANTKDLERLTALIDSGQVKVIVDSEFKLEDIKGAYDRSKTGRATGKIVIHVA